MTKEFIPLTREEKLAKAAACRRIQRAYRTAAKLSREAGLYEDSDDYEFKYREYRRAGTRWDRAARLG